MNRNFFGSALQDVCREQPGLEKYQYTRDPTATLRHRTEALGCTRLPSETAMRVSSSRKDGTLPEPSTGSRNSVYAKHAK
ncbi:MAG: hypothetical protein U5K69_04175 [Balneolaceae bacterium]|nr:hypothetical protein [Balneolaceae bacterium]